MSLYGQQIKREEIAEDFVGGPGEVLIPKLIAALSATRPFQKLFGPWSKPGDSNSRWADYARADWSLRQLPAINIFEKDPENKSSPNGWLTGMIGIQVFWPASFRRSDLMRIPRTFSAAMLNFFESERAFGLFAEVPGLNELGKTITWQPNIEGLIESELVPVSLCDVNYRVDLRAWYRFLELDNRTKEQPFERTLGDLEIVGGKYVGVNASATDEQIQVEQVVTITAEATEGE